MLTGGILLIRRKKVEIRGLSVEIILEGQYSGFLKEKAHRPQNNQAYISSEAV